MDIDLQSYIPVEVITCMFSSVSDLVDKKFVRIFFVVFVVTCDASSWYVVNRAVNYSN